MIKHLWHSLVRGCSQEKRARLWQGWPRLVLPLMTAAALAWFLIRVIPKPIRATYPCQRAAFPIATAFVIWLLGLKTGLATWWVSAGSRAFRPVVGACSVCLLAVLAVSIGRLGADLVKDETLWEPSDPPNTPMGIGKGIYPGRVVWMRDTNATPWTGAAGTTWWTEGTGVNQDAVDRMLSTTLRALTGATNDVHAWARMFEHYNSSHGKGTVGYQAGETIAIKINCNNAYGGYTDVDNHANASPQAVLGLLRQLINRAGVPQQNITVYEAVRVIPNCIYNPCHAEFPEVVWADSQGNGGNGRQPLNWHTNVLTYSGTTAFGRNLPAAVYESSYLINMAILKGHWRAGVTLTAKNHFGSINLVSSASAHNNSIQSYQLGMDIYHPFVDMIGSPHLGGKTLLFLIDGLYGTREVESFVSNLSDSLWVNLFRNDWSASFFASLDPVAVDSVGLDFLRSEFGDRLASGHNANADAYMHEAAMAHAPASGTAYIQNGARLKSLGAHEHWNNAIAKDYSRNLGNPSGIELVKIETSPRPAIALVNPGSAAACYAGMTTCLLATALPGAAPLQKVEFYHDSGVIGASTSAPYVCDWTPTQPGGDNLTAVAWDAAGLSSTSAVVRVTIKSPPPPPNITGAKVIGESIEISFSTVTGLTYRVDSALSPDAWLWTAVRPSQVASNSVSTVTDRVDGFQKYYRAVFVP